MYLYTYSQPGFSSAISYSQLVDNMISAPHLQPFPSSSSMIFFRIISSVVAFLLRKLPSLKLTAKAPENGPGPKRKRSSSNHPFSGATVDG